MSPNPRLQCLFCQHLNRPDAEYCSHCDAQLNLQPCDHCGAVDLRVKTHCYQCGARFPRPDPRSLPARFTPAVPDQQAAYPVAARMRVADAPADISPATFANPARGWRSRQAMVAAALLLAVAAAAAAYWYRGQTIAPPEPARQATEAPRAAAPVAAAPADPPVAAETAPAPGGAPGARPTPASDAAPVTTDDRASTGRCPPAVETLGLCRPDAPQGKP